MVFPKARIVVAALLLIGWLGYLFVLVAMTRDPVVLSRPQILVCNLAVLADIEEQDGRPNPDLKVTEVLWAANDDKTLEGQRFTLSDVGDLGRAQGWRGAGRYLLALTKYVGEEQYRLTRIPEIPGFLSVTVNLVSAGPNAEKVSEYLRKTMRLEPERAKALAHQPGPIERFSERNALDHKDVLVQLGATVELKYETRIYPATDDALRQFWELKPNR